MKDMKFEKWFSGILAYILLLLYGVTVGLMILHVYNSAKSDPSQAHEFSRGVIYVVTTIGGLVSALVVAKLAATTPGKNPGFTSNVAGAVGKEAILSNLYLIVWGLVGLGALIVGVMLWPDVNKTLHDVGASWLGLAIAAGYAYFGIKPKTGLVAQK